MKPISPAEKIARAEQAHDSLVARVARLRRHIRQKETLGLSASPAYHKALKDAESETEIAYKQLLAADTGEADGLSSTNRSDGSKSMVTTNHFPSQRSDAPLPLNEEACLHFAMRYALGRISAAPSIVAEELKSKWSRIRTSTRGNIKREFTEAIEANLAGERCDIEVWKSILSLP